MRRRRAVVITLSVVVLCACAWLVIPLHEPPGPVYQGKSLKEWLEVYQFVPPSGFSVDLAKLDEMTNAVRQIGTNGIPALLRMLRAHDSAVKTRFFELLQKQSLIKIKARQPAFYINYLAAIGFEALGPSASNAVPDIIAIYQRNLSDTSRCMTIKSLGGIGQAAEPAIPCLLESRTNASESVRFEAVRALGRIQGKPDQVVLALAKSLKDSDDEIRFAAVLSLGMFGTNAKAAVPALVECLTNGDADVAGAALKQIDPEAAAKAGIK